MKHIALTASMMVFLTVAHISCTKTNITETGIIMQEQTAGELRAADETLRSKVYLIEAGEHDCKPNPFVLTSKSQLTFTAAFDSSCIYTTADPNNQNDINKLFGFSDCNGHHLENSARVGWRWSDGALRLFAFVHNNGEMVFRELTTARIGSIIKCRITCLEDSYLFEINNASAALPRHCPGRYSRYKLFPYFGGDETAPHDIRIAVNEVKN